VSVPDADRVLGGRYRLMREIARGGMAMVWEAQDALLDHREREGVDGFFTITGGKLTTYRLMAKDTVDALCRQLGESRLCTTATERLPGSERGEYYRVGDRLARREEHLLDDQLVCECELISRSGLEQAFRRRSTDELDDMRRMLRLGMGPCQGGFCIYRATGILHGLEGIDTEHLFGFTMGTDVGSPGEREFQSQTTGRFSKSAGNYRAINQEFELEFVPAKNFRIELGSAFAAYDINGVADLEDRRHLAWQGISVDLRYRFLDRDVAPFGLTFALETHSDRIDDRTAAPARRYTTELTLALDRELIPNRVVAAFNLFSEPEWTHFGTGLAARAATVGGDVAMLTQMRPGLRVVVSVASTVKFDARRCPFSLVHSQSLTVLRAADAGLWKSGTTTLEAAIAESAIGGLDAAQNGPNGGSRLTVLKRLKTALRRVSARIIPREYSSFSAIQWFCIQGYSAT